VCARVCVHAYVRVRTFAKERVSERLFERSMCVYVRMCVRVFVRVRVKESLYGCVRENLSVSVTDERQCLCVHVRASVCVCACV